MNHQLIDSDDYSKTGKLRTSKMDKIQLIAISVLFTVSLCFPFYVEHTESRWQNDEVPMITEYIYFWNSRFGIGFLPLFLSVIIVGFIGNKIAIVITNILAIIIGFLLYVLIRIGMTTYADPLLDELGYGFLGIISCVGIAVVKTFTIRRQHYLN